MSYERTVELQRWPGIGFGFSVIGGSDTHIPPMICALVRDSPALMSKKINVGDVLCKVNGINVSTLETKQVVDLIRNCKQNINLSLKEDRLAKLKARPFLAEGTLIEPPPKVTNSSPPGLGQDPVKIRHNRPSQNQQRHQLSSSLSSGAQPRTRTVGSPRNNEYGTDGNFQYRQSKLHKTVDYHPTESPRSQLNSQLSSPCSSTGSSSKGSSVMGSKVTSPTQDNASKQTVKAHLYNLDDLPRSPRYFVNQSSQEPSYQSLTGKDKYYGNDYFQQTFTKPDYINSNDVRQQHGMKSQSTSQMKDVNFTNIHRQTAGRKYNSYDKLSFPSKNDTMTTKNSTTVSDHGLRSAPYGTKKDGNFDFQDGCVQSTEREGVAYTQAKSERPYSNPELDVEIMTNGQLIQKQTSLANHKTSRHQAKNKKQSSNNYSSPNIFSDSEAMYSEQKALTLTPYAHSNHSLSKDDHHGNGYAIMEDSIHSPLHVTLNNSSIASSSTVSPLSYLTESDISSTVSSQTKEEVSPADIASRLFTLNGYEDSDVAPLLGKNSDFSQQICREYLRFFNFEGIALDEALRIFLAKFPLTGETQERERILIHFSKRFYECNQFSDMNEDGIHFLVCAMMLLNTDLHGQSISNRMTLNDFINNLSGLNDGKDFPKEYLKTIYNAIKNKEIIFASIKQEATPSPKPRRKNSAPGNPFIELKVNSNDAVIFEGLIYRKSVMDPGGRRTPAMRRNWRPFYCILKGLVLLSHKPDNWSSHDAQSIGIHHALAGYAKDYKKRMFVFKLITADWSVYYMQVKNQDEVKMWMDSINVSAALLSSPPLPAPVGSSVRFQRPVMPVSRTRLDPTQQLGHLMEKVQLIQEELSDHLEYTPEPSNKFYQDWENKKDYLEYEVKRFKAYVSVLTTPKLVHIRQRILATIPTTSGSATVPSQKHKPPNLPIHRSSSMHSLTSVGQNTPNTQRQIEMENRKSYALGAPSTP